MLQLALRSGEVKPWIAVLEVFNVGDEAVEIPKAHIGFTPGGILNGDYFEFEAPVHYIGHESMRDLDPSVCLTLLPNHSHVLSIIDLRAQYFLSGVRGSVRARYNHGGHISNWARFSG